MVRETLGQVRNKIEETQTIETQKKTELLRLLTILELEIERLAASNPEHAESILRFTQTSAHEATRRNKSEHLFQVALQGLSRTVEGIEKSHAKLTDAVNSICISLSNLGV